MRAPRDRIFMQDTANIDFQVAPPGVDYRLPDVVEPRWWEGVSHLSPLHFSIDLASESLPETALIDRMRSLYEQYGIVRVINRPVHDLESARLIADEVMRGQMGYEAGANSRNYIAPNIFEVGAPLAALLHYHHEMAYIGESPLSLAFLCQAAAKDKGHTYFSDNIAATDAILATPFGQRLKERGVCYHRTLTDRDRYQHTGNIGIYNHWQQSLGTEDADQAMVLATAKGLLATWGRNGSMVTRYYADAFEYHPGTQRNLLFSSIADSAMWFDTWPLIMHLPHTKRPLHMTYGDDTPFSSEDFRQFVDVYDRFGIQISWSPGDIVIFCNYRFAHGRPGIHLDGNESRILGVLLGSSFKREGQRPDAW